MMALMTKSLWYWQRCPPEQEDKDGVHAAGSESISTETPVPQIIAAPADDKLGNALEALATARVRSNSTRCKLRRTS